MSNWRWNTVEFASVYISVSSISSQMACFCVTGHIYITAVCLFFVCLLLFFFFFFVVFLCVCFFVFFCLFVFRFFFFFVFFLLFFFFLFLFFYLFVSLYFIFIFLFFLFFCLKSHLVTQLIIFVVPDQVADIMFCMIWRPLYSLSCARSTAKNSI